MASHALLEKPLKRKSFKHSIRKGFLYKRSAKCEKGESLKKERSKTYQPMYSCVFAFRCNFPRSLESNCLKPWYFHWRPHYLSLLKDMNSLKTPFYPATGHVHCTQLEKEKARRKQHLQLDSAIFSCALATVQGSLPLLRCSAQTQTTSVRHAR